MFSWLKRKQEDRYPAPLVIVEIEVDPVCSAMDLAQGMDAHREAQAQAEAARAAVAQLRASRIRNGFAPVIEETIIKRYLGSAS